MTATSNTRVACPHAERCGGCALLGLSYGEQLLWKQRALGAHLARYRELREVALGETLPAEDVVAYRLRAKLAVEGAAVGLFARGTHDVVDLPQCRVLEPRVARAVDAVRAALPFEFALLALDARAADDGVLVTLVVDAAADDVAVSRAADALRRAEPQILGVAISRRAPRSPQLLGSAPRTISGADAAPHRLDPSGPAHPATPGSFVQAHAGQAARLHHLVERELTSALGGLQGQAVLELYAGSGALALALAKAGARVTAIDSFEPGMRRLEAAAREQGVELRAVASRAEAALDGAPRPRAIVVDPPRRGLSPEVRRGVARLEPEAIAVVACNPATFARDLADFARQGYVAERVVPFDMIPLSDAIEAFALLRRARPTPLALLHASETLLVVDKPPFLPTTPQGEHPGSLLDRVRALDGAERAVPVHRLDIGTSGVCLFARAPEHVEELAAALARSQKHYRALVRGIVHASGNVRRPLRDGPKQRYALTRYRRERVAGTHSLVWARPEQGRQHQIRRHFGGIGHPVLGDARYGDPASNRFFEEQHGLDRPFLHLARLELALGPSPLLLEAELAPDLVAVLESLEGPRP